MENNWVPGPDNFSPSGGLLNYQWSDTLLQMELDEMQLLESQQAQAQVRPWGAYQNIFVRGCVKVALHVN